MTDILTALDRLFVNAEARLSQYTESFTSQEFLRWLIHDQQHAYIDLLVACSHLSIPFDQAHQKIGRRLSSVAPKCGFEPTGKAKDKNIFGLPTASVIYTRTSSPEKQL